MLDVSLPGGHCLQVQPQDELSSTESPPSTPQHKKPKEDSPQVQVFQLRELQSLIYSQLSWQERHRLRLSKIAPITNASFQLYFPDMVDTAGRLQLYRTCSDGSTTQSTWDATLLQSPKLSHHGLPSFFLSDGSWDFKTPHLWSIRRAHEWDECAPFFEPVSTTVVGLISYLRSHDGSRGCLPGWRVFVPEESRRPQCVVDIPPP